MTVSLDRPDRQAKKVIVVWKVYPVYEDATVLKVNQAETDHPGNSVYVDRPDRPVVGLVCQDLQARWVLEGIRVRRVLKERTVFLVSLEDEDQWDRPVDQEYQVVPDLKDKLERRVQKEKPVPSVVLVGKDLVVSQAYQVRKDHVVLPEKKDIQLS